MNSQFNDSGVTSMNSPDAADDLDAGMVRRVARKAHETVDKIEQSVASGSEKVMTMQEEYGSYAREQIRANPLTIVAGAFALGLLLGRILR